MDNSEVKILGLNITLVYKALNIADIDYRRAKDILNNPEAVTTEFPPDLLVFIDPSQNNVLQFSDRRIRISHQTPPIRYVDLSNIAVECHKSFQKSDLLAYGLNFDLEIELKERNLITEIANLFGDRLANYMSKLGSSKLKAFIPRTIYFIDEYQHDFIIETPDPSHALIHLNVHRDSHNLPTQSELSELQRNKYDYLVQCINELLGQK